MNYKFNYLNPNKLKFIFTQEDGSTIILEPEAAFKRIKAAIRVKKSV